MPKKICISVVTYNSRSFLKGFFDSLFNQSFKDFEVVVIDNDSSDGTAEFIKENYSAVALMENDSNKGFAGAHNQGIAWAVSRGAEFVLVANPDIVMCPDFLRQALSGFEGGKNIFSVGGKLLKANISHLNEEPKSDIIDSTGLRVFKNRRIVDRGAGEKDSGQYERREEVFGVSGALALFRVSALSEAAVSGEYFDEDFFTYKEDVDLAWRLRILGGSSIYEPTAVAYHYRGAYGEEKTRLIKAWERRKNKSSFANFHSYKNHLLLLIKNDFASNFFLHFPHIALYELKKFIYILFFETKTLYSLKIFFFKLPTMIKKRKIIMSRAELKSRDIRRWIY